jgi:hypothetical protein
MWSQPLIIPAGELPLVHGEVGKGDISGAEVVTPRQAPLRAAT